MSLPEYFAPEASSEPQIQLAVSCRHKCPKVQNTELDVERRRSRGRLVPQSEVVPHPGIADGDGHTIHALQGSGEQKVDSGILSR